MSNLKVEGQHNHDEYNSEPVIYCSKCLSIRIRDIDGTNYCDKCGCTDLEEANIFDWEKMYAERYSRNFLDTK